jgi:hypothetical protein
MYITRVPPDEFRRIVELVSTACYEGNVQVDDLTDLKGVRYPRMNVTLNTAECKRGKYGLAPGARRVGMHSYAGRKPKRWPKPCWHAMRDILATMFVNYPEATCRTALADYRGRDGFLRNYPDTYWGPQRSGMFRLDSIGAACDCDDDEGVPFQVQLDYVIAEIPYP